MASRGRWRGWSRRLHTWLRRAINRPLGLAMASLLPSLARFGNTLLLLGAFVCRLRRCLPPVDSNGLILAYDLAADRGLDRSHMRRADCGGAIGRQPTNSSDGRGVSGRLRWRRPLRRRTGWTRGHGGTRKLGRWSPGRVRRTINFGAARRSRFVAIRRDVNVTGTRARSDSETGTASRFPGVHQRPR